MYSLYKICYGSMQFFSRLVCRWVQIIWTQKKVEMDIRNPTFLLTERQKDKYKNRESPALELHRFPPDTISNQSDSSLTFFTVRDKGKLACIEVLEAALRAVRAEPLGPTRFWPRRRIQMFSIQLWQAARPETAVYSRRPVVCSRAYQSTNKLY